MADRVLAEPVVRPPRAPVEPDPFKGGDIYAWAMRQAALLREGRFNEVDIVNVADEIEDVGKSDLRALKSNVEGVLTHMLKWDHQPERRGRSWVFSIANGRIAIEQLLEESPSMAAKREDIVAKAFQTARLRAAGETLRPVRSFPSACPYTWAQIMETPYELENGQD